MSPKETAKRQQIESRFMELLARIAHRYRSELEQRLRPLGCGPSGMEVLAVLRARGRPVTQNEIAARMGILNSTLTRLIVPLEQAALIERVQDRTNLRAKLVELTPEGKQACNELTEVAGAFRAGVLAGLTADDLDSASEVSTRLLGRLSEAPDSAQGESAGMKSRQEAELTFIARVVIAARRYRGQLDEQLRSLGCGTAAMETMAVIARSRQPLSQVEIAGRLGIEGATLTRMLGLLERKGWVSRLSDPADGRAKRIALTGEGKKALRRIDKAAGRFHRALLEELSDEDLAATSASYEKVLKSLLALP